MRIESSRAPRVAPIDVPVRRLVRLLNRLPGCSTISSCGGHPGPLHGAQVAQGRFYVDLELEPSPAGWATLALLTWLCDGDPPTTLTPWSEGPLAGVRFDLRGTHESAWALEADLTAHLCHPRGEA